MKVAFLDIDGVVATDGEAFHMLCSYYGLPMVAKGDIGGLAVKLKDLLDHSPLPKPRREKQYWPFSQEAIENVYALQRETGCKFVLSSDWKIGRSLEEINDLMALKGLRIEFYDKTVETRDRFRPEEVGSWLLGREGIERYVIIDDAYPELGMYFPGKYVRTSSWDGFTKPKLEEALAILNAKE